MGHLLFDGQPALRHHPLAMDRPIQQGQQPQDPRQVRKVLGDGEQLRVGEGHYLAVGDRGYGMVHQLQRERMQIHKVPGDVQAGDLPSAILNRGIPGGHAADDQSAEKWAFTLLDQV